jgi:prepilin-type N-terminal cleavage/methylation domain-containing protein
MNKKSFTIVELLVVMAVIGILITLAVVGIQALQKSQRELSRQNDLRNIASTLAQFYSKYRRYPYHSDEDQTEFMPCEKYVVIVNPGHATEYGTGCNGDSTPPQSASSEYARIPLSVPGVGSYLGGWMGAGGYETSWSAFDCNASGLNTDADTWHIVYGSGFPGSSAQTYILGACTEGGKTTNFGTRPDDVVNNF